MTPTREAGSATSEVVMKGVAQLDGVDPAGAVGRATLLVTYSSGATKATDCSAQFLFQKP